MNRAYAWAIRIIIVLIILDYGAYYAYLAVWSYLNQSKAQVTFVGTNAEDNSRTYNVKISRGSWYDTGIWVVRGSGVHISSSPNVSQPYWGKIGMNEFRSTPILNGSAFSLAFAAGDYEQIDLPTASVPQEEKLYIRLDPQVTLNEQTLAVKIVDYSAKLAKPSFSLYGLWKKILLYSPRWVYGAAIVLLLAFVYSKIDRMPSHTSKSDQFHLFEPSIFRSLPKIIFTIIFCLGVTAMISLLVYYAVTQKAQLSSVLPQPTSTAYHATPVPAQIVKQIKETVVKPVTDVTPKIKVVPTVTPEKNTTYKEGRYISELEVTFIRITWRASSRVWSSPIVYGNRFPRNGLGDIGYQLDFTYSRERAGSYAFLVSIYYPNGEVFTYLDRNTLDFSAGSVQSGMSRRLNSRGKEWPPGKYLVTFSTQNEEFARGTFEIYE
jgi:hypothetical protein